jgi:GNAT superfamily N-acetyltransferase
MTGGDGARRRAPVRPTPGARPDNTLRVLGFDAPPERTGPSRLRLALRWLNARLGSPYVRIDSVLYAADLDDPLPPLELALPVRLTEAAVDEAEELAAARFPEAPARAAEQAREFRQRLVRGDICLLARVEGRIASYVWVTRRHWWDPDLDLVIPVAATECLGYEAYTVPVYRRRGLRQALQIAERRLGRALGKRTLLFELHGQAERLALDKWEPLGLRQRPIAQHTTVKLLGRLKRTRVVKLGDGRE